MQIGILRQLILKWRQQESTDYVQQTSLAKTTLDVFGQKASIDISGS